MGLSFHLRLSTHGLRSFTGEPRFNVPRIRKTTSQTLQLISTRGSRLSMSLGFSIFGILLIVNQHQADLNGLSGSSSFAAFGGIAAILVGTGFLVTACLNYKSLL